MQLTNISIEFQFFTHRLCYHRRKRP